MSFHIKRTCQRDKEVFSYFNSFVCIFQVEKPGLFQSIIRSPTLLRRVCTTPIWWITTTFVYYGLSINSTSLSETMHLNFILTAAIEIPGLITAVLVLNRIGRKATLSAGFLFSALCNIVFVFISNG